MKKIFNFAACVCVCAMLMSCNSSTEKTYNEKTEVSSTITTDNNKPLSHLMECFTWKEGQITAKDGKAWDFYAYAESKDLPNMYYRDDSDYCFLTHDIIKLYAYTTPRSSKPEEIKNIEAAYYSLKDGGVKTAFYYDPQRESEINIGLIYWDGERVIMRYEDAVSLDYIEQNSNTISFKEES